MKKVISYVLHPKKTNEFICGGIKCNTNTAYEEFVLTKQNYKKEKGRQYIHFVQSFSPQDKVTPEKIKELSDKFLKHKIFEGFQIVYSVHTDKPHLHTHYVVNTVNEDTGRKWQLSKEQLQELKDYSDELCKEYSLIIVDGKKGEYKKRGEYRSKKKGASWKGELFLVVNHCKRNSISKDDFINNMQKLGYKVNWIDNRKYITFTTPEGKKCRNRALYPKEMYTKGALLDHFEKNKQYQDTKLLRNRMELLLTAIRKLDFDGVDSKNGKLPLTQLEGDALKEKIEELKKGKGLEFKSNGYEL